MSSFRSFRALAAVLAVGLATQASAAHAQVVTAAYAPSCGPGTACGTLRFTLSNASAQTLVFNTLTLNTSGAPFLFATLPGGTTTTYSAVDAYGIDLAFGGSGTVNVGGTQLVIAFEPDFQFTLNPGTAGYIETSLRSTPALVASGAFQYSALLVGSNTPITGAITSAATVPEPATFALVGGGLALVGLARRRRRV